MIASQAPPTGDLACNAGMCPDWESNLRPFGSQASIQSTAPHQPGQHFFKNLFPNHLSASQPLPPHTFNNFTILIIAKLFSAGQYHIPISSCTNSGSRSFTAFFSSSIFLNELPLVIVKQLVPRMLKWPPTYSSVLLQNL